MTLPKFYQHFAETWAVTPGTTIEKARIRLLYEERRTVRSDSIIGTFAVARVLEKESSDREGSGAVIAAVVGAKLHHCRI